MPNLQNDYVQFIQRLLDDEKMQMWFVSLSKLSANERIIELRNLAFKMSHSNEDEAIIKVVTSLSSDEVYDGIRAVLLAELNKK
jgi:hypothetical protein